MGAWGLICAGSATVIADRLTKMVAVRSLAAGARTDRALRLVSNQRPFLRPATSWATLVALWVLAAACGMVAVQAIPTSGSRALAGVGLAVALGGAASNLVDRVSGGAVVDFIALGRWPVFNLADAAIVLGAAVALGSLL